MTERFSEDEVILTVTRLTRPLLVRFIQTDLVKPRRMDEGYVFGRIDIARLELLCDLSLDMDLDETVMGIIVSLIDQLHIARQDLQALTHAIDNLPTEMRDRSGAAIQRR
jgi:chaperone modulatory protein CbpM